MTSKLAEYYRQPEIYITLPSGGQFYPEGSLEMGATGELPVYGMTAKDDVAIKTPDALISGEAVVQVIKSCIPSIKDPWQMPASDVDFVLVAIRIASYGEEMEMEATCNKCEEEFNFGIDLTQYIDKLGKVEFTNETTTIKYGKLKVHIKPLTYNELSLLQMNQIETYVRDFGRGLVVIGGNQSFGRGAYEDTSFERILPLKMIPKTQKESLSVLMLIELLVVWQIIGEADLVGVVSFSASIGLQIPPTTDHQRVLKAIGTLRPRNGTQLFPALQEAYKLVKETEAKQKHIVILSDGKSDGDFESLTTQIAKNDVTITTLAIGDVAQDLLQTIARNGKGRYVHVKDMTQLPRVLAEEVHQIQEYTVQEMFVPRLHQTTRILDGISQTPHLYGYIATSRKETGQVLIKSHKDHPILAVWDCGLGRSVAFTSDLKGWGRDWIRWENFGKFWIQVVSSVLPRSSIGNNFDVQTSINGAYIGVTVEAKNLRAINDSSELLVRASFPNHHGQLVEMIRTTPTHYEGRFEIDELGVYLITAKTTGDQQTVCLVVPYSSELTNFETNQQLLHKIANQTNGTFKPSIAEVASRSDQLVQKAKDLAPMFLIICIIVFVLEMVIRQFRFRDYQSTVTRESTTEQWSMQNPELTGQKLEIDSSIQKLLHVKRQATTSSQMTP